MDNQTFLDLFNELDRLLREYYSLNDLSQSAVSKRIRELNDSPRTDKRARSVMLDSARNIRNLLVHNPNGSIFLDVSNELIDFMKNEIKLLTTEKKANDIMIPFDEILFCENGDNIKDIIYKMREKKYTNVPILKNKYVVGVFNENSLLTNIMLDKIKIEDTIDHSFFLLENDYSRYYGFTSLKTKLNELEDMFEERKDDKRLELIFVTQNGLKNEKILGIITVYDVIENN